MRPVLCALPGVGKIGTYSTLLVLSYALAIGWLWTRRRRLGFAPALFVPVIGTLLVAAVVGAKLGYFAVEWPDFRQDPRFMLETWSSGWVLWGGWLLGFLASLGLKAVLGRKLDYWVMADHCVASIALAQPLGRLGCFAEGCCHGRPTSLPWGVVFRDVGSSVDPALLGLPLHPTQLLEAAGTALAAWVIIRRVLPGIERGRLKAGTVMLGYAVYYSALRFAVEFLRGDDRGTLLPSLLPAALSPSQWTCLAVGLAAAAALRRRGVFTRRA